MPDRGQSVVRRRRGERTAEDLRTRQRTLNVLDAISFGHNPATDWDAFFDALWEKGSTIRDDPDPS